MSNPWQRVCSSDDIAEYTSKGFTVNNIDLFVVRNTKGVFAYKNQCPHLGIGLEWVADRFLTEDGDLIQCATHGALFTPEEGFCVSGPCSGEHLIAIECRIRADAIEVKTA